MAALPSTKTAEAQRPQFSGVERVIGGVLRMHLSTIGYPESEKVAEKVAAALIRLGRLVPDNTASRRRGRKKGR